MRYTWWDEVKRWAVILKGIILYLPGKFRRAWWFGQLAKMERDDDQSSRDQ